MRTVLIYRDALLPPSETFILEQAGALLRYRPQFVGRHAVAPSLLPHSAAILTGDSGWLTKPLRHAAHAVAGAEPRMLHAATVRHLRTLGPSMVHAHFAPDGAAALPIAQALGVPLVVTLHGYDVTAAMTCRNPVRGWVRTHRMRSLCRDAALFLCVSEFIRGRAIAAGFPAQKLLVHRIGIDTRRFHPSMRGEAPNNVRNDVLFVGRLTEKKGCRYLIRAMRQVQRSVPYARLLVVGKGQEREMLESLAAELDVRCAFLGRQNHEQVLRHLTHARICAIPSVTAANGDSEGLPMILAEAQGLGVPVVASRHAGIPEGIVDGEAGLLSEERDVAGLASNILRLLQDESLYNDISRRGAELVQRDFSLRHQTDELEAVYDAVLSAVPLKSWRSACATL